MHDLAVAYRIYPGMSRGSLRSFGDKRAMAELCLRSFRKALGSLRVRLWAILDNCPDDYAALFQGQFGGTDHEILRRNGIGNAATFALQREILSSQTDSELVYLAEDDYLYRPGQLEHLVEFMRQYQDVDFASPYDHPDAYSFQVSMSKPSLRVYGGTHWRTTTSTCLTFMARKQTLISAEPVFASYGRRNYDASMWHALTKEGISWWMKHPTSVLGDSVARKVVAKTFIYGWKQILFGRRYSLWSPIPSAATHLQEGALAPNVDWQDLSCL